MNNLMLMSGINIPFPKMKAEIHQPTIKEISLIGENNFFKGCELLNFSKDFLEDKDKIALEDKTNFEIFMSIMNDTRTPTENKINIEMILTLMFPDYQFFFTNTEIIFQLGDFKTSINKDNYEDFKKILIDIFCLNKSKNKEEAEFNPLGKSATLIANKLKKAREQVAKVKNEDKKEIHLLSRYISILSVGERKNVGDLMDLTIYQLFDEFHRFELKQTYDAYFKARLAGAQDLEEVENWMIDIHS